MTINDAAHNLSLRPVRPQDEEFLCAVYGSTRAQELAMTPWNEEQRAAFVRFQFAAQQQFYQSEYPQAEHHVILLDDEPVGRLYVDRRAAEIRILDITLLPERRSQGLGTPLLKALMSEAVNAGLPLTIHLETFNPARTLFARLGFVPVGDNGMHTLFEWRQST
jgi:GNAT superfamily N-acetyltransferase